MKSVEDRLFDLAERGFLLDYHDLLYSVLVEGADLKILNCNKERKSLICTILRKAHVIATLPEILDAANAIGLPFENKREKQYAFKSLFNNSKNRETGFHGDNIICNIFDRLYDGGCIPDNMNLPITQEEYKILDNSRIRFNCKKHNRLMPLPKEKCRACGSEENDPLDPLYLCSYKRQSILENIRFNLRTDINFYKATYVGEDGRIMKLEDPQERDKLVNMINDLLDVEEKSFLLKHGR